MQKARLSESEIIESAECIIAETAHMSNVASSLLELATLRDYKPEKNKILLSSLFDEVAQTLEGTLLENDTELICRSDDNVVILGQEDLLRSLLLNLCTNAINACAGLKGEIQLDAAEHDDCVIISVADNGCGIPEESLPKLSEPFYRVDKSRSRKLGGTGIGLSLCAQIVKAHGAKMSVQSTLGVGTVVEVSFTTP
jgi:signal transduction histidine kinase